MDEQRNAVQSSTKESERQAFQEPLQQSLAADTDKKHERDTHQKQSNDVLQWLDKKSFKDLY